MSNEKALKRQWAKRTAIALLGASVLSGTFLGNGRGFAPLYNVKTGNSYGINLGFVTKFKKGSSHYGLSLSVSTINEGEINGLSIGILNLNNHVGKINGLELGLANAQDNSEVDLRSLLSMEYSSYGPHRINGLQIGIYNDCAAGNVVQVGIVNQMRKGENKGANLWSGILNLGFNGRKDVYANVPADLEVLAESEKGSSN